MKNVNAISKMATAFRRFSISKRRVSTTSPKVTDIVTAVMKQRELESEDLESVGVSQVSSVLQETGQVGKPIDQDTVFRTQSRVVVDTQVNLKTTSLNSQGSAIQAPSDNGFIDE